MLGADLTSPAYRWLIPGIVLYLIAIGFAVAVQAPAVEKMVELTKTPPGAEGPPRSSSPCGKKLQRGGMFLALLIVAIVFLMVVKPGVLTGRPARLRAARATINPTTTGDPPMPYVASSPADLLAHLEGAAHLDGDRLVIDDEAGSGPMPRPTWPGRPRSPTDEPTAEAARWLVWEASQALGARSASIHELYMARARGEVSRVHRPGAQHPRPDVRHGAHVLRDGRAGRRRRGDLRARPLRADVHLPAADGLRHRVLAGAIAAGWQARCSSRATTTSSTRRSTRPIPRR